jgi:hypothetical protein
MSDHEETAGQGHDQGEGEQPAEYPRGYGTGRHPDVGVTREAARAFLAEQYAQPVTQAVAESMGLAYLLAARSAGDDGYTLAVLTGLADAYHEHRGW